MARAGSQGGKRVTKGHDSTSSVLRGWEGSREDAAGRVNRGIYGKRYMGVIAGNFSAVALIWA